MDMYYIGYALQEDMSYWSMFYWRTYLTGKLFFYLLIHLSTCLCNYPCMYLLISCVLFGRSCLTGGHVLLI